MPVASFPVRAAAASLAALALLTSCSTSRADEARTAERQYLAIGDSYAAGYRPALDGGEAENTTDGFAWKVAEATGLGLVNVSCSGITTVAFVNGDPCEEDRRAPGALAPVKGSEAAVALDHLDRHADDVELVTVVLGANDLRACSFDEAWRRCVAETMPRITKTLDSLLSGLRERLGPEVPIVGLTYPDIWLGAPVRQPKSAEARRVAQASVEAFRTAVNPALRRTYAAHGATFVDVTRAFGAYLPADRTIRTSKFGTIPARAARVCAETYACSLGDAHPTPEGHQRIADLVLESLEGQ
ncbi:SGNH/GDSL hydrolase family protein [Aeromicrobium duanguangcaii]|uniref:SGNH/GDSL hydrolase family protein n=1 Tax=Aeromicrobium duanguangcaii TaxID=2968086 RepID=UPI0020171F29|nr:GDSL-type esterase/lipase family protein [Aeromicrobium duanguangcaii]